ncbi:MAG: ABC transporter ATP-binding protein [Treponema sp.]|nr:ABC transporter ATP-binding protein [Treponema sp.]
MAVVTLKDVHKVYPMGKQKVEAVKGVSFDIEKGEFAAISGPSGSGKSTILNMTGLIDLPSSGSIIIGGTDVYEGVNLAEAEVKNTRWASSGGEDSNGKKKKVRDSIPPKLDKRVTALRRSHIGFIFQTFNLIPVLNVYENIEFPLLLESKNPDSKSPVDSFTKAQKEEWISFLMEKVGLTDWKNHKATELSGGQRQRVAIARALVTKAPVILADEPTANLDSKNSEAILSLMKSLNKDPDLQTTFIFSTHDSRIVDMCDHVVHILDGQIIQDEYKTGSDVYNVGSR